MKLLWTIFTLAIASAVTALPQHADAATGLFLEPGVTLQYSNSKVNWPSPADSSTGHVNGFGLVGKAGFHINEIFFVAVDARYAVPHFTDSSVGYSAESTSYQIGPVVGIQLPGAGPRAWIGYVADSQLDPKSSGNYDVKFTQGTGLQLGGGLHLGPVSLNLEYQYLSYAHTEFEKVWVSSNSTTDVHMTTSQLIASLTFPLEF